MESTGDPMADKVLRGLTRLLKQMFSERLRGIYLRGSYASGSNTAGSDLDAFVVLEGAFEAGEQQAVREFCDASALLSPILLEVIPLSEEQLRHPGSVVLALNLKLGTRIVDGEDIRDDLPDLDVDAYTRAVVHTPYFSYKFPVQRRDEPALVYPLEHLDPDGEFYGYDQWMMPAENGLDGPSTKLLIASVGWTATAIVVLRTGLYVQDKTASTELYAEHVADQWTDLVVGVHEYCRNRWHYKIPTDDVDRLVLRELCERALEFQNHYLTLYRDYQLRELESGVPMRQRVAAGCLGQVLFRDTKTLDALRGLLSHEDLEVRDAARATLDRYEPA